MLVVSVKIVFKNPKLLHKILSYLNASSCISFMKSYKELSNTKILKKTIGRSIFDNLKKV